MLDVGVNAISLTPPNPNNPWQDHFFLTKKYQMQDFDRNFVKHFWRVLHQSPRGLRGHPLPHPPPSWPMLSDPQIFSTLRRHCQSLNNKRRVNLVTYFSKFSVTMRLSADKPTGNSFGCCRCRHRRLHAVS